MANRGIRRAGRLRLVGAVAYTAAALIFLSTLFGVFAGSPQANELSMDVATFIVSLFWLAVMLLPFWALRWVHADRIVRSAAAAFVALLALGEVSGIAYRLWGEATAASALYITSVAVALLHLVVGLALGTLLLRRAAHLQGLHGELAWALIAYVVLGAAWFALPEVLIPLSGVALTVAYIALGIIFRRSAAQAA